MIANLLRARAGEELAEALAVGERQLRARAAVEVHAVDDALVGQVVVREQAQVARAPRRREQDRRVHAGRCGSRARARAARRARPTTRCSGCGRRRRRRRTGRRPAAATRERSLWKRAGEVARERRAPARLVPPWTERMTTRWAERAAATAWRMAARRSSELATAETSRRTVLTPIAASTLRVVLDAGELLGVDACPADRSARRAR